jgi:nicotinate-nucleotide adenylyltransferase
MVKSARIGIFGGSFNPVHNGHLHLAEFALSELNLDKVYFVPSHRTPLKKADLLPAALRLRCLREALREKKRFAVSTEELRRGGTSYTVDTLKVFRRRLGPETTLYFLAGADNAKNLSRWKSPDKVLNLCRFTILSRPGAARSKTPPGVLWAPFPALDVSSSDVRRRLKTGRSLKGLVPSGVERILRSKSKRN